MGGERKTTSRRGRRGTIRPPLSALSPATQTKNGFVEKRRRRQQTKKLGAHLHSPLQTKLHSALGDIGNLVAPLARVNVSQAEKARAQEVSKGLSERGKGVSKSIRASRAASLFFLRRKKRGRASSSKTLVRQLPIAREIRRPLRHRCSCFCRVCDVESLLYDADLVRGEKGSPHGRCCQVFFFSLHRATNHNRRRAFFFSKKKNSTSPFFSNTTTNQNTNRRSSSPRLPSPAPAEGPPGLPLPPLLPPLPLP